MLKSGVLTSTQYGYDGLSRLLTVSDGTNAATYGYLTNSPLVGQISFTQSGATRMTTTKGYDYLNRLTAISSAAGSTLLDSHGYAYNSANQRTGVTNADGSYWVYQYDALGQVTGGVKRWSDGSLVPGQQFGYGFDDIGNRKTTTAGGDPWGNYLRPTSYSANDLNQYTGRTVPGAVDVSGATTNTATVTVNNQATYRHGTFYRAQLPLSNTSSAVWQSVTNLAVLNEGTNTDYAATNTGNVFLPQTPESFTYDADGNLASDGRWTYTWDGENRLLSLTSLTTAPAASKLCLNFVYDAKGRRIQKTVSTWNGTTYASPTTLNFAYDGWNLIAILNAPSTVLTSFTWGLDLSGSMQGSLRESGTSLTGGAGGVGGLLGVNYYGSSTTNAFAAFDGNGNVSGLINAANSSVLAQYEYGPFGELIRKSGPFAAACPFRFSTKYQDDECDLVMYPYRPYNTSTGRWLSRDPIEEKGGNNIYAFVLNSAVNAVDPLGHSDVVTPPMGPWIYAHCACACKQSPILLQSLTSDAANEGQKVADGVNKDRTSVENEAVRHCVASALLALYTGCACSTCAGNYREYYQDQYQNQKSRDSYRGRHNNGAGVDCAGCTGDPLQGAIRHGAAAIDDAINCCLQKLENGSLDTAQ